MYVAVFLQTLVKAVSAKSLLALIKASKPMREGGHDVIVGEELMAALCVMEFMSISAHAISANTPKANTAAPSRMH